MYKQLFVLAVALTIAYAGIIAPLHIGLGGISYTQRLNGYGPILGIGHIGHIGHLGHHGHIGHLGHHGHHLGHHGHLGHHHGGIIG